MGGVLRGNGINFHAKSTAIFGYMSHFRLRANLSFLDKKMQADQFTFFFARSGLKKEAGRAEITDA